VIVQLTLIVLRVSDLERSRTFYAGLGLDLVRQQHGDGPVHYACMLGELVLELYPHARPSNVRLGLRASMEVVTRMQAQLVRERVYLVRDPDGNAIELTIE
jgi:catechol 2,3-dioxygenase-like lactoylglutathione lyase family enzyme